MAKLLVQGEHAPRALPGVSGHGVQGDARCFMTTPSGHLLWLMPGLRVLVSLGRHGRSNTEGVSLPAGVPEGVLPSRNAMLQQTRCAACLTHVRDLGAFSFSQMCIFFNEIHTI